MYNSLGKNVQQNTKKGKKMKEDKKKIDNNGFEVVPLMRLPFPFPFLPMIKEKKLSERKIVEILDASKPASRRPVAHFALATTTSLFLVVPLCYVIRLLSGAVTLPHAQKQTLHVLGIDLTVEQRALRPPLPHFGSNSLQTTSKNGSNKKTSVRHPHGSSTYIVR
jgi:hypothetical protein